MSERKLYVGVDLRDAVTQIAVWGPSQEGPEVLTVKDGDGGETPYIETAVAVPGSNELVTGFLAKIAAQEPVVVEGRESDPVNILAVFFRRTLSMTKKKYPQESIKKLVVTAEYDDYRFISVVFRALEKLSLIHISEPTRPST